MKPFTSKWIFPLCLVGGIAVFGVTYHMSEVGNQAVTPPPEEWGGHNHPPPDIFFAIQTNNADMLKELLEDGVDPNQTQEDGSTPLHIALGVQENQGGIFGMVRLLLDHGANPNQPDNDGYTPMNVAADVDSEAVMTIMIQAGGDPNHSHPDFITPFESALTNGNTHTVAAIEKHTTYRPEHYQQKKALGIVLKAMVEGITSGASKEALRIRLEDAVDRVGHNLNLSDPTAFINTLMEQASNAAVELNESDLEELLEAPNQR